MYLSMTIYVNWTQGWINLASSYIKKWCIYPKTAFPFLHISHIIGYPSNIVKNDSTECILKIVTIVLSFRVNSNYNYITWSEISRAYCRHEERIKGKGQLEGILIQNVKSDEMLEVSQLIVVCIFILWWTMINAQSFTLV